MIDMPALIAPWIADDSAITDVVPNVYSDEVPEGVAYPWLLVRVLEVTPAAPPTVSWDTYELQIDVVGDAFGFGPITQATSLLRDKLMQLSGVLGPCAISACDVIGMTRITDDSISPARPRWVLAVEVTARDN